MYFFFCSLGFGVLMYRTFIGQRMTRYRTFLTSVASVWLVICR